MSEFSELLLYILQRLEKNQIHSIASMFSCMSSSTCLWIPETLIVNSLLNNSFQSHSDFSGVLPCTWFSNSQLYGLQLPRRTVIASRCFNFTTTTYTLCMFYMCGFPLGAPVSSYIFYNTYRLGPSAYSELLTGCKCECECQVVSVLASVIDWWPPIDSTSPLARNQLWTLNG